MAAVHISNVEVLNNPSGFFTPFKFQLTFECNDQLSEDLEWKMIYVGSAESEKYDQVLETIYVGPVPEGRHTFTFQANGPDVSKIPEVDIVGVTIILISCSYRKQEFVRVGYFVNNDYADPVLRENPPPRPIVEQLTRNILASKPRVTRFKINWCDPLPHDGLCLNGKISSISSEQLNGGDLPMDWRDLKDGNKISRDYDYIMNGAMDTGDKFIPKIESPMNKIFDPLNVNGVLDC